VTNAATNTLSDQPSVSADASGGSAREHGNLQDRWASFVAQNLCRFSIRTQRESNFKVDAQTRADNGFVVARVNTVAGRAQLERTAAEIRGDGRDSYCLYVPVHGSHQLHQCHRDVVCAPETVSLITIGEPYIQTKLGDNDTLYLLMPRAFVDQRLLHGEDICARLVSARDGVGRLAADTLAALQREASNMSAEEFRVATRAAGDLVLLAVAGAADLMSDTRSIRASNLARAKRIIRARLADPDLSLSDVARACGLSLRYLHDLFRDDGRTAREYLQGERLLNARRMLERSSAGTASVTDVCMACGFSNPSQFSTAFRRAFGVSPRDVLRRT
jgi:AraC-like DNA-binding protein